MEVILRRNCGRHPASWGSGSGAVTVTALTLYSCRADCRGRWALEGSGLEAAAVWHWGPPATITTSTTDTTTCTTTDIARQHGENLPGLLTQLPPHLLVHPLSGSPRQSRRTHIKVLPRQPGKGVSFQFSGECWLRSSRGASSAHRTSCSCWHILRVLQNNTWLEIWACIWIKPEV